jgi:hypothetical protein
MILYEPLYYLGLRQHALSLTVEVGQSVWASRALVAVVEQFAQASRLSAAEPISEVEWDVASEVVKDRYGEPERGGEWEPIKILLEGDVDSNKTNEASNTRLRLTIQVGQAHVATGVTLDLGTNTQPSEPRHTNTHSRNLHDLLPVLHRSDRWPAPVRPVTPVRPADRAGQVGGYSSRTTSVPKSLSDFSRPWNKTTPKNTTCTEGKTYTKPNKTTPNIPRTDQQHQYPKTHESSNSPEANPTKDLHRSDRSRAPVRPV